MILRFINTKGAGRVRFKQHYRKPVYMLDDRTVTARRSKKRPLVGHVANVAMNGSTVDVWVPVVNL